MMSNISDMVNILSDKPWPDEKEYLQNVEPFTALVPVYVNDYLPDFKIAIKSVIFNSINPDEILIIQDGPVSDEMADFIFFLLNQFPNIVRTESRKENRGLGFTAAQGMKLAKNELVARIDADDISNSQRFKKELAAFKQNKKLDIVGSNIAEFDESFNLFSHRNVPTRANDIDKFSKMRSPFNHPSVMFKKAAVMDSGNYHDIRFMEDYDLWMRMLDSGKIAKNIAEDLVYMRASKEMYQRRGGIKYLKTYRDFRKNLLHQKLISNKEYYKSVFGMTVTSVIPTSLRTKIYKVLLRKE